MKFVLSFCLLLPLCLLSACPAEVPPPKDDPKEKPEPDPEPDPNPITDAGPTEPPVTFDAGLTEPPFTLDAGPDVPSGALDAGGTEPQEAADAGTVEATQPDAGDASTVVVDAGRTEETPVADAGNADVVAGDAGNADVVAGDAGTATCPVGTTGDGVTCIDINECSTYNGGCDANALCTNAAVSGDAPLCECDSGYEGDGLICTDINECSTNNGGCDANALCTNAAVSGDAPACACGSGYEGDGLTCTDINECDTDNGGCPSHATCADAANAGDAPLCTCNAGYTEDAMGTCKPDALDWDVEYTNTNHSIFILDTALDGIAEIEPGDYIGVFYTRENDFSGCGAYTEWLGETTMLAAQGEEFGDVESDGGVINGLVTGGFQVGEEFHWLFWDASSGNTFSLNPIFDASSQNGNAFVPDGISLVVGFDSPHPGWVAEMTDNNHSIFLKPTAFDNWPEIESGDYVGVFFEDSASEPQCGGLVKWEGAFTQISAFGVEGSGDVDGFDEGEEFQWQVWDASADAFYEATATFAAPGQEIYAPNGVSFVENLVATP